MWWANKFLNVKEKKLYLGDKDATKVAKAHGTPLYVYSKKLPETFVRQEMSSEKK
jgi:diaminopimelate decarboxylase